MASDRLDASEPYPWFRPSAGAQSVPTRKETDKSFMTNDLVNCRVNRSDLGSEAKRRELQDIMSQACWANPLIRAVYGETNAKEEVTE